MIPKVATGNRLRPALISNILFLTYHLLATTLPHFPARIAGARLSSLAHVAEVEKRRQFGVVGAYRIPPAVDILLFERYTTAREKKWDASKVSAEFGFAESFRLLIQVVDPSPETDFVAGSSDALVVLRTGAMRDSARDKG